MISLEPVSNPLAVFFSLETSVGFPITKPRRLTILQGEKLLFWHMPEQRLCEGLADEDMHRNGECSSALLSFLLR